MNRILLTLLAALTIISAEAQKSAKRELRGAWITTYLGLDWPVRTQTPTQQRSALLTILDHHKATGLNTVYFQVRSQSDAMYPSTIEPWSYYLTGQQGRAPSPLWDPLQFALDESRNRGLEFHAWINPFRAVATLANAGNTTMFSAAHISKTHPEWLLTVGTVQILNPGLPEVRAYVNSVIVDILKRYDLDGIHFDDYFYPSGTINDNAAYTADPRGFPATTAGRADWRRDNINLFIKGVYDSILTLKPWVKFGVSPTGIYRSSTDPAIGSATSSGALQHYSAYFADTRRWLQEGWVDYIAPQLYWYISQPGSNYAVLVPWWNNNAFGRHIYIGIAAYKVGDAAQGAPWLNPSQIPNQVRMNRSSLYPNVLGSIYFRSQHLRNNRLGFRDSLRLYFYNKPALQPTMPWRDITPPQPASSLIAVKYGNDSVVLNWTKPPATSNELDRARQFVIYRSTNPIIDTADANNILAITVNDTTAYRDKAITPNTTYYYTVSALDRFHNESALTNIADNLPPVVVCPAAQELILNASCAVTLPDYTNMSVVDGMLPSENNQITMRQSPAFSSIINGTGTTVVTITATDRGGNSGSCTFEVQRKDITPPVISGVSVNPSSLWAPNHKMRNVTVAYNVFDNCGQVTSVLSVTSNEHVSKPGSGDTAPDWEILDKHRLKLRAERSGSGSGRIYTITITATDASGNVSTANVTVSVPHSSAPVTGTKVKIERKEVQPADEFSVKVSPNPATDQFVVFLGGKSSQTINIYVSDNIGRVVERRNGVPPNGTISLGTNYRPGTYFIDVIQGSKRKLLK